MLKYILKRIAIFLPTFLVIGLITFSLSQLAPGDPVELMMGGTQGSDGQLAEKMATEKTYQEIREKLGLHLPVFYFSFSNRATPDTLHNIGKRPHKENLERFIDMYGNWPRIQSYYLSLKQLDNSLFSIQRSPGNGQLLRDSRQRLESLYKTWQPDQIAKLMSEIEQRLGGDSSMHAALLDFANTKNLYREMTENPTRNLVYIPDLKIYGFKNQFHIWLFGDKPWFRDVPEGTYQGAGFVRGDFGISYMDKRPVKSRIWEAVTYTFFISLASLILAYLIAVPIGVYTAVKKDSGFDRITTTTLFILYSLPSFWVATMLIIFLCQPQYLDWFPPGKVMEVPDSAPLFDKIMDVLHHMVLPLICWTYGSLAFLSRQMRGGMLSVILQDYIRTAKAKGLSEKVIVWKHAFRNSLIPIITMFAAIFPAAIGGSVVLEYIFTIPGMGKLSYEAVISRDYPIVFTVLMLSAILTMVGMLVADILYSVVDPRISFTKKS